MRSIFDSRGHAPCFRSCNLASKKFPMYAGMNMNVQLAIDLLQNLILTALWVVSPFLILTMVMGFLISLFQSITSIQDQTLAFVPKIVGVALLLWVLSEWLFRQLIEFTTLIFERMGEMVK